MTNRKIIFSLLTILFWCSLYSYVPQMANYAKEMGASYKLIGLIASAYGLSQTVLRIPLGILSDKLMKRKVFVIFGVICTIISAAIIYIFPNPYTLLIGRFVAGVASATWVNFTILFLSYFDSKESNKSIGIATANSRIGQLIGMFAGGFIAVKLGIREIFLVSILLGFIALMLGIFVKEDKIETKAKRENPGLATVIRNRRVLSISSLGCISQLIAYSTTFGFTPLIANNLGANVLQLSYLSTVYTIPQIIFSVLSGTIIVRKLGERKTLFIGFVLLMFLCIITPFAPNLTVLYIIQFFNGIGGSITFPLLMAMVVKGVESNLLTTTMGFFQAVYGVGMIVGPVILGAIADTAGLTEGFMVVGLLSLLSIWVVIRIRD